MRLLVTILILGILLLSMTGFAASPFSSSSAGHAYLLPDKMPTRRTLTSAYAQAYGWFGSSVSTSGGLVAVGAIDEGVGPYYQAGNVYVFNATSGALITNITSPNIQDQGWFGYSVSLSGNLLAVSTPYEKAGGYSDAGHAYVFNAISGALIQTLTSPNAQAYGYFGYSVSLSGTLVAVGAYGETAGGYTEAGNAYVFNATTGALITAVSSPNAQSDGLFGISVSLSSNLLAVGAQGEVVDGYSEAGNAYVFNATSGALITSLTSPNPQAYGYFGCSLSLSSNLLVVGALGETASGYAEAGHAYVFNPTSGTLITTLSSPKAQSGGEFGYSLSLSGNSLAVGAPGEKVGPHSGAGRAYIFNATSGALIKTLSTANPYKSGAFGNSVSLNGNLAVVGAPHEKADGYLQAGHAYIFYKA